MYVLPLPREQLLFLLPKGGETAEIGVLDGKFSRRIIDVAQPRRHHMIDPWSLETESETHFNEVQTKFASEIDTGKAVLHRGLSNDMAKEIADRSLDWVYIDGDHTYKGAMDDLIHYAPKVKPGGHVLGHDYADHQPAKNIEFDVVRAVNDFVRQTGYVFVAMTAELYPTFVLAESWETPVVKGLVDSFFLRIPGTVEIADYPGNRDTLFKMLQLSNGQTAAIPSF